jgi:hypothetical protein
MKAMPFTLKPIIWENGGLFCKKLGRMRKYEAEQQRKCAKTAFMRIFEPGQ